MVDYFFNSLKSICKKSVVQYAPLPPQVQGVVKGGKSKGEEREERTRGRKKVKKNIFALLRQSTQRPAAAMVRC